MPPVHGPHLGEPCTWSSGESLGYNKHQVNARYSYKIDTEADRDFSHNFVFHCWNAHFKKKAAHVICLWNSIISSTLFSQKLRESCRTDFSSCKGISHSRLKTFLSKQHMDKNLKLEKHFHFQWSQAKRSMPNTQGEGEPWSTLSTPWNTLDDAGVFCVYLSLACAQGLQVKNK